jgi:dCMP deaminase
VNVHRQRLYECFHFAQNSPDPSTKVGARLYSSETNSSGEPYICLSKAFNSFPASIAVGPEYYDNRELKYDRMIHSEMRCLLDAGSMAIGGTLYTSMVPCKDCAKHIAEARLVRVYYPASAMLSDFVKRQSASVHTGILILAECGVDLIEVEGI